MTTATIPTPADTSSETAFLDLPRWIRTHSIEQAPQRQWGQLPGLSVLAASALLAISLADVASRHGAAWAELVFWIGLVILFAPIAARLAWAGVTRLESLGLVVVLGLGLYLVKVLHSPVEFTFHDEFPHWRTANDIFISGHLFHINPLQPVSSVYPGLEIIATALAHLGGISLFTSGLIVGAVARLLLLLSLYLLYEQASGSTRVAGVASLLYMANPNYVFWSAQFSYESLALPMGALALYLLARGRTLSRAGVSRADRRRLTLLAVPILAAVVVMHHLTSYQVTAFLLLWSLLALYSRYRQGNPDGGPGLIAMVTLAMSLTWLLGMASITVGYLAPHFEGAVQELVRNIVHAQFVGRRPFHSSTGAVAPLWERLIGFGSAGLILLTLPLGLWRIWRRDRRYSLLLALSLGALAYPASLVLRLTGQGWEIANRASESVFVALSAVLAMGIVHLWLSGRFPRTRVLIFTGWATVIFVGGAIAGWPPAWRLPGQYRVAAVTRSIEPQGVDAATWARAYLGPNNHVATDATNALLMGSYGEQDIEITLSAGIDPSYLFLAPQLAAEQWKLIKQGHVQYIVVDRRLTSGIPLQPQFLGTDPRAKRYLTRPLDPALLSKFDHAPRLSRVFDSGSIQVFRVGAANAR